MYFCTCLKEQVASFGFVCGTIGGLQVTGSLGRQRFSGSRAEIFRARMSSFSIGMGSNSLEGKNGTIRQGSCSQIGWNEMSFGLRNCVTNRMHWFFFLVICLFAHMKSRKTGSIDCEAVEVVCNCRRHIFFAFLACKFSNSRSESKSGSENTTLSSTNGG